MRFRSYSRLNVGQPYFEIPASVAFDGTIIGAVRHCGDEQVCRQTQHRPALYRWTRPKETVGQRVRRGLLTTLVTLN